MINRALVLVKKKPVKRLNVLPVNRIIERRMALKLDDLIGKKKEVAPILDLAKVTANSSEEFKKIMEKVPEFRMRPEKVRPDDIKMYEKEGRGRRKKSKKRAEDQGYQFADPVPEEMRSIKLSDLCTVNIQWNMLTTLRPKSKTDTEYFSRKNRGKASVCKGCFKKGFVNGRRLVELGKLELATQEKEKKITDESFKRKMKNRAGVVETRYISCADCGEDFCQKEACQLFTYENFRREPEKEVLGKKEESKRGRPLTKKKRGSKSPKKRKSLAGPSKSAERRKSKGRPTSKSRSKSATGKSNSKKETQKPSKAKPTKRSPSKSKEGKKEKKILKPKKINKS